MLGALSWSRLWAIYNTKRERENEKKCVTYDCSDAKRHDFFGCYSIDLSDEYSSENRLSFLSYFSNSQTATVIHSFAIWKDKIELIFYSSHRRVLCVWHETNNIWHGWHDNEKVRAMKPILFDFQCEIKRNIIGIRYISHIITEFNVWCAILRTYNIVLLAALFYAFVIRLRATTFGCY